MNYSPTKVILLFFILVIAVGSALLSLPFARESTQQLSFLTNIFTATSAACVTGLTVVDIGAYYSFFGQLVILFLVQIGGLGYMTLSTVVGLFIGKIALKERAVIKELMDVGSFSGLLSLLKKIIAIVLIIEAAGAVILTALFLQHYPFAKALYFGVFHSVSAFCNAGLSPLRENLAGYAASWPMLLTVALLVITGGLGFLVLIEIWGLRRERAVKLSVHSRVVLVATLVLIITGLIGIWIVESGNTLHGQGPGYGFLNSFFQSVSTRTAGFNSIDIGSLHRVTAIFMALLMFIGASPGGTGGGIKTTTFVILLLFVRSVVRDKDSVTLYRRRISSEIAGKAVTIFILSLFLVIVMTMLLVGTERFLPVDLLFEAVSAFGTVGLSRGITAGLTDFGKIIIMLTMVIGRVGPLAFLLALLARPEEKAEIKYPEERILVG
ncbi:MAG: TrkH family potassium uptake protein [Endomicrobiales bacterium]